MTYYYIYKITNKINHKIYYGQHTTSDLNDGYMGSGLAIKRAIKKYGIENFEKKILKFYNSIEELNIVEARLVNKRWLDKNSNRTYNLQTGGKQRQFLSEKSKRTISKRTREAMNNPEVKKKISDAAKGNQKWLGRKHTEESKKKMSLNNASHRKEVRDKISKFRKSIHWYNNGIITVQRKECPEGFVKGRLKLKKYTY